MTLNPFTLYTKAVRAVPSVKYALGVAGIVAAGAMALALFNGNSKVAILSFVAVLLGMCLLVVFAAAANTVGRWPGFLLIWSVTILFVSMLVMTVTALAFGLPSNWAKLIGAMDERPTPPPEKLTERNASVSTTEKCAPAFVGVSVGGSMSNTFNCSSAAASAPSTSSSGESENKK